MLRCYAKTPRQRADDRRRLDHQHDPGRGRRRDRGRSGLTEADLAIDWREDRRRCRPRPSSDYQLFEAAGAKAKVSSIHVNGWFGDYDKLAMTYAQAARALRPRYRRCGRAGPVRRRFAQRRPAVRVFPAFGRGRERARLCRPARRAGLGHRGARRRRLRRADRAAAGGSMNAVRFRQACAPRADRGRTARQPPCGSWCSPAPSASRPRPCAATSMR